jgi:SPP1 family predicted phage head-tail adaptor
MGALVLDPGMLRTRLVLEDVSTVPDDQGGHTATWAEVAELSALVEPLGANAKFGADQTLETVSHRIFIRARSDLASGMRFRKGNRVFDIVTVHDPDETGRYLVCATRETGG